MFVFLLCCVTRRHIYISHLVSVQNISTSNITPPANMHRINQPNISNICVNIRKSFSQHCFLFFDFCKSANFIPKKFPLQPLDKLGLADF